MHIDDEPSDPLVLPDRKPSAARRRANEAAAAATGGASDLGAPMFLIDNLVGVRESSEYDYMLFAKMIQQTLEPLRHLPGVAQALELGVSVFDKGPKGEDLRRQLGARALTKPGTDRVVGYLFVLQGTWFLYALTSAAKTSSDGDNFWIESLCSILRELRPKNLWVGPASRVVRRKELAGRVTLALKDVGTRIFPFEARHGLDLRVMADEYTWDALVTAADFDYKSTLTRLLTGTIFELKNNRFPRAEGVLPPGFCFAREGGTVTRQVVPDVRPDSLEMVRDLLRAGAGELTDAEIAKEFSARGLTARSQRKKGVPVAELDDPGRAILGVFQHLKTYVTGTYTFRLECPILNLEELHGLPIHRVHPEDNGFFEVDLQFELPPGGFVDEATARALTERRLDRDSGTAGAQLDRSVRKPIAGRRTWEDDTYQYVLDSDEDGAYVVRRRPKPPAGAETRISKGEGEIVGRLPAADFHVDVARAAVDGLGKALATDRPATSTALTWFDSLTGDLARLRSAVDAGERETRNLRALAGAAADVEERQHYAEMARTAKASTSKAQAELAAVQGRLALAAPGGARVELGVALPAFTLLGRTSNKAPYELYEAIRDHLVDLRVDCAPRRPTATVEFCIRLNSSDGSITLGPFRFSTRSTSVGVAGTPERAQAFHERNQALLVPWILGEQSAAEIQNLEGISERSLFRRGHTMLQPYIPNATARSALLDCPVPETRAVVLAGAMGFEYDTPFSDERAELIRRTYLDPDFDWTESWVSEATELKRRTLAFIDRNSDDPESGVHLDDPIDALGVSEVFVYRLLNSDPTRYTGASRRPAPKAVLERVPGWPDGRRPERASRRLRVFSCRWCGGWSMLQPLRVPEVSDELICTACGCSAGSDEPWPATYLQLWDGPFGRTVKASSDALGAAPRTRKGSHIVEMPPIPLIGARRRVA